MIARRSGSSASWAEKDSAKKIAKAIKKRTLALAM
jgi:hypothetical protein